MAISWINSDNFNRTATGQHHPDVAVLTDYLEGLFLENQTYVDRERRLDVREERSQERTSTEERNKIVREYNERERKKKEEERAKLIEQAKKKGLGSSIGSLEV